MSSNNSTLAMAKTEAERIRATSKLEAENKAKEIELAAKQQQLKLRPVACCPILANQNSRHSSVAAIHITGFPSMPQRTRAMPV